VFNWQSHGGGWCFLDEGGVGRWKGMILGGTLEDWLYKALVNCVYKLV
jgi:hypothetical protein